MLFLGCSRSWERGMFLYFAIVKGPRPICQSFSCKVTAPEEVNIGMMPHEQQKKPSAPQSMRSSHTFKRAPARARQRGVGR
jgi:hypothetical protein